MSETGTCGCCEGTVVATPVDSTNGPGLSAIAYRIGTHARFKQSMLARLTDPARKALGGLRTRRDDDFSIALLDAWACVADVVTFYQERIANESYLRTATERRSLLELARLIGYELRPGVAASTWLAFTVEDSPGVPSLAPKRAAVDKGTRVQSVPAPGEKPQVFETIEGIEARVEWNAMRPRLTRRQPIIPDTAGPLLFEGLATGLKAGDGLLLIGEDGKDKIFRQVRSVTLQALKNRSEVALDPLPSPIIIASIFSAPAFSATLFPAFSSGGITTASITGPVTGVKLSAASKVAHFATRDVFSHFAASRPPSPAVVAFRTRAAIFGHNAPFWETLPVDQRSAEYKYNTEDPPKAQIFYGAYATRKDTWVDTLANFRPDSTGKNVHLDTVYPGITANSWIVLKSGSTALPYRVGDTAEVSLSDFTLSAKVTRLGIGGLAGAASMKVRDTTVYAQGEELALARQPIDTPVAGEQIELEGFVDGLRVGQSLIVSGELSGMRGVTASERVELRGVEHVLDADGATRLTVSKLANSYVRDTAIICGNVARATHGETVQEVLGSGDAAASYQRFALRQPPLTFVKAPIPSGARAALEVRVNELLWHEVPTLRDAGPGDRVFTTRIDDDGTTSVRFGDGTTGSRLPTGRQNVRATYRRGIGTDGLVDAGQLSLLLTRPLGVKGVNNPIAAEGAANPESLADARRNAPLTVLTLDRAVSLRDYQDFAQSFAGVAKALATWTTVGTSRGIFITVAGPNGAEIRPDSDTYINLLAALRAAGDPFVELSLSSYRPALFSVGGRVKIHGDFIAERVLADVNARLAETFGFDARSFGEAVTLSAVVATIQSVDGVVAVDVDRLQRIDDPAQALRPQLRAATPLGGETAAEAAELLTLHPDPVVFGVMP